MGLEAIKASSFWGLRVAEGDSRICDSMTNPAVYYALDEKPAVIGLPLVFIRPASHAMAKL
jgi:hypothetical protein